MMWNAVMIPCTTAAGFSWHVFNISDPSFLCKGAIDSALLVLQGKEAKQDTKRERKAFVQAVQQASSRASEGHSSPITKRSSHFVFAGSEWLKPNEFNGRHGPLVPPYAVQVEGGQQLCPYSCQLHCFHVCASMGKTQSL